MKSRKLLLSFMSVAVSLILIPSASQTSTIKSFGVTVDETQSRKIIGPRISTDPEVIERYMNSILGRLRQGTLSRQDIQDALPYTSLLLDVLRDQQPRNENLIFVVEGFLMDLNNAMRRLFPPWGKTSGLRWDAEFIWD